MLKWGCLQETELRARENDLTQKMVQLLRTEEKLRSIENDLAERDDALNVLRRENAAVAEVNVQLKELAENLQQSLIAYEDQSRDRDIVGGKYESDLAGLQKDLRQTEAKLCDAENLVQSERVAKAGWYLSAKWPDWVLFEKISIWIIHWLIDWFIH